ncbi:unnamed protein product, partial [Adineta ricciae]
VWEISVNLHVLDYDGNILDCGNLAALCALAHFRYPAVTVIGTDVHVHSITERNPQPVRILHFPIIITFALFKNGEYMLIDACEAEEKVMEGLFAVGMNQHKELSTLTMLGEISLSRAQIQNCISVAHHLVIDITKQMRSTLEKNKEEQLKIIEAINHPNCWLLIKEEIYAVSYVHRIVFELGIDFIFGDINWNSAYGEVNQLGGVFVNGRPPSTSIRLRIVEMINSRLRPCEFNRRFEVSHSCIDKILTPCDEIGQLFQII